MEILVVIILITFAIYITTDKSKFKKNYKYKDKKFYKEVDLKSTNYKSENFEGYENSEHREKIEKGRNFEEKIGKHYEDLGYTVAYHGIDNGKKDKGIDLIAKKDKEIVFIQCKNWKKDGKKINIYHIKAFIADTYVYMENNPMYSNYKIKRIFAISNPILTKAAYAYIKNNRDKIEYLFFEN